MTTLPENLIVKTPQNDDDIERLAAFNGMIHGDSVAGMTRHMLKDHPTISKERHHWPFIEDIETGQVVSALCLITWPLQYENVLLKAGEVGIVGTHPDYRKRGLIRHLMAIHEDYLNDGDYDLAIIQGIPYYYRQFGYEYAIPLEGGHHVHLHTIPDYDDAPGLSTRPATLEDCPTLNRLYNAAVAPLNLYAKRDVRTWEYLLGPGMHTETAADTWLLLEHDEPVSYVRVTLEGFGEGLITAECGPLDYRMAQYVLAFLRDLARERDKPFIRLNIAASHPLVKIAQTFDAQDMGTYAWQLHIPDVPRLLRKLSPVLERRLFDSPFRKYNGPYVLNLYREKWGLLFEYGDLIDVLGIRQTSDLSLPPLLLAPLVMGYRSREELNAMYPDVLCNGPSRYLTDVLFPKMSSFLYTQY